MSGFKRRLGTTDVGFMPTERTQLPGRANTGGLGYGHVMST